MIVFWGGFGGIFYAFAKNGRRKIWWGGGFDSFFGFMSGGHKYFDEPGTGNPIFRDHTAVQEKEYLTDALTRQSLSFIGNAKEKPFFLYLAYNAGHTPLQATRKYLDRFLHIKDVKRRTYAAMLSAMDDGIKEVLDKLKSKGVMKNTLIFVLTVHLKIFYQFEIKYLPAFETT